MYQSNHGELIRLAREKLGLTQQELARRVGTTQAAVSYVEQRRRIRKKSVLLRYAIALELPVELLTGGEVGAPGTPREHAIWDAFEVICRDEDFGFGARGEERLSLETMLDIVRLYERYKAVHLLPPNFV